MPYVSWEAVKKSKIEHNTFDVGGRLYVLKVLKNIITLEHIQENFDYMTENYKTIKILFNKPLTEENYYEALRLAKKLFLGEEYESRRNV